MITKNLEQLRGVIFSQIMLSSLALNALGVALAIGMWQLMAFRSNLTLTVSLWLLINMTATTLYAWWMAKVSLFAANYLTQALLAVSSQNSNVEPPTVDKLKAYHRFLSTSAQQIYSLAGGQNQAESSGPQGIVKSDNPKQSMVQPSIDQLANPTLAIDGNDQVVFTNPAANAYFHLDDQAIGRSVYDVLNLSFSGKETLEGWLAKTRGQVVNSSQSWERVRHTFGDSSRRQFDMVAHYQKNDEHSYDTLLSIMDHTNRYTQEDRDVSFVAMAVHELRTPLTAMRGYIEVFEDELSDKLNNEQKEFMNNMSAQAQQLADFVSNILNVARVEENQLRLKLRKLDWADAVRQTITSMELRARVRGLQIKYQVEDNLPPVMADKVSSMEVLINLLDNALKYTHNGKPIVVRTYVREKFWVETTVTDQGVGMPENVMQHLFRKFYRSHHSSTTLGTGLGLYLSRALVNAQGGEIWVQSKQGQGSTFGFTLPIHEYVKDQNSDNNEIVREAHGWIKNHSLHRG